MTQRAVAPVTGVIPQHIADYYHTHIAGVTNSYVDYFVTATDGRGNSAKSQIFHVWVGEGAAGSGGGGNTNPCSGRVCVSPAPPVQGQSMTISYDPTGGPIAGHVAVHARRPFAQGLDGIHDGGRRLVLDGDRLDGILGDVAVVGHDEGHRLADVADLVGGEWALRARLDQRGMRDQQRARGVELAQLGRGRDEVDAR